MILRPILYRRDNDAGGRFGGGGGGRFRADFGMISGRCWRLLDPTVLILSLQKGGFGRVFFAKNPKEWQILGAKTGDFGALIAFEKRRSWNSSADRTVRNLSRRNRRSGRADRARLHARRSQDDVYIYICVMDINVM